MLLLITMLFTLLCSSLTVCVVFRYRDQRDRPDLSNPESMQLYLETRFEQLKVSYVFVVPLLCCMQGCHSE